PCSVPAPSGYKGLPGAPPGGRRDAMRGHFITFEGGEGSGKSTHAAALAERLQAQGIAVVRTREPLGAEAEAFLFAAARDDHVRNTILPALEAGRWVICDRFIDSTRVYQGALG